MNSSLILLWCESAQTSVPLIYLQPDHRHSIPGHIYVWWESPHFGGLICYPLESSRYTHCLLSDICKWCGRQCPAPQTTCIVVVSAMCMLISHFSAFAIPVWSHGNNRLANRAECGPWYESGVYRCTSWKIKLFIIFASTHNIRPRLSAHNSWTHWTLVNKKGQVCSPPIWLALFELSINYAELNK